MGDYDLNSRDEDIRKFITTVRSLREQIKYFESECQRKANEQLSALEELLRICDYLLYQSSELHYKRRKKDISED